MEERDSIRRLKAGDIGGLEWLVSQYQRGALRVAYLVTADVRVAEETVQDAFVQAYRRVSTFDENRAFRPWFMRIVVNMAAKAARKEARHSGNSIGPHESLEDFLLSPIGSAVETESEQEELRGHVWNAMLSLTPRQRSAIVRRYFLDMSEWETAIDLGVPLGTAKWLLSKARDHLRAILAGERSGR